jgi:hypothetical protein
MSKFKGALDAIKHRQPAEPAKRGKRRDPNYQQITAYLPQETYHAMKIALAQDRKEMSELFEELIRQWLKTRASTKHKG